MVVLASMPKEWMVFISMLGAYTILTEVIMQIMAHDSLLSCDCLSQGTPTVVKALATAQTQRSQLTCLNPVCECIGHIIKQVF